ncbi:MAG: hypothetical protein RMY29_027175 [Nostoc sp. CreGUA01]|nr:hypothetical protein [Nostoc sp. CreGUA01]
MSKTMMINKTMLLFNELNDEESANINGGQIFPGVNAPLLADPTLQTIYQSDPLLRLVLGNPIFSYDPVGNVNFPAYVIGQ